MAASTCKFCGNQIFWCNLNGKNLPFDDQYGTQKHQCEEFKKETKSIQQQIFELREQQKIDHNLIVKLISKFEENTRKITS